MKKEKYSNRIESNAFCPIPQSLYQFLYSWVIWISMRIYFKHSRLNYTLVKMLWKFMQTNIVDCNSFWRKQNKTQCQLAWIIMRQRRWFYCDAFHKVKKTFWLIQCIHFVYVHRHGIYIFYTYLTFYEHLTFYVQKFLNMSASRQR